MRKQLRLIAAVAWLLPAAVYGADIQQVAASACGQEGCCNMRDCVSCDTTGCYPCQDGSCCQYGACCNSGYCSNCSNGHCSTADVLTAHGMNWCHPCGPIGTAARINVPGAKKLVWCSTTKAAPDAGWAPPARLPIYHTGGGFGSWYGNHGPFVGGHPMVYQPTDTAQLGFTCANTPVWTAKPYKIPPVPQPSMFHMRTYVARDDRCFGGSPCSGHPAYGHPIQGAACPACMTGGPMMATPVAQQQPVRMPPTVQMRPTQPTVRPVSNTVTRPTAVSGQGSRKANVSGNRPHRSVRRPATRKSSGWFGLPSLSEIKF